MMDASIHSPTPQDQCCGSGSGQISIILADLDWQALNANADPDTDLA